MMNRGGDGGVPGRYVRGDDYVKNAPPSAWRRAPMRLPSGGPAGVAELADALDLGSSDENRGGSNPPARTSAVLRPIELTRWM
jgi:hypothetical protein